ncbi:histidine kinase [Actinoplanes sp. SE50]|uniref:GAF domain-containing sensor histidine kinase n=1 Tax=unclassified Actinoplanes TaxID=2626549 RepID=UPI00023EBCFB|nr:MULTISPECIES: GAF domain-containing sensor histidine kinase [unclassified Actinoplanes]AEV82917.1 GAF sensor signal transduction histidine kinase [Actinoplanes sp. SE50/110]ATO81313.1 histidine kinase [Actinoplanes sp. SE50]SLL98720.1 histidine kinase [Actinoplanes sp. SE50/110]
MSDAVHDESRLAALRTYQVLDRPRPAVLDDLTRLAATMFDTPMAAVSLVDRDRQWFAGNVGLADAETPLDVSFCARLVPTRKPLIVPDATRDPHFRAYRNVTGDPHIRFYAGAPVIDGEGHVLGAMCVIDDEAREIGDRQIDALTSFAGQAATHLTAIRGRLRLAELGDELARAAQREEDLVATITHELRTPVTSIQGYLELLAENDDLEPYRRLIEPIHRNGRRLVTMVDHILAGTRPHDAPLPAPVGPIDLNTAVAAALTACRALTGLRTTPVTIHPASPAPILADLARLAGAIEQLLRNALLFTPADRPITVRVTGGGRPAVEVRDSGVGIPQDELPYVFDRFYRGQHARDQAVPGVGLGLTIARATILAHLGTLEVTSDPHGTTARITFPALD